jgi:hypothetical protein
MVRMTMPETQILQLERRLLNAGSAKECAGMELMGSAT